MSTQFSRTCHKKLVFFILLISVAIAAVVLTTGVLRHQQTVSTAENIKIDGVFLTTPKTIADFQLTTNDGKPFTKENLKGHLTMMFFGFTNCSYVCPTTMSALNKMYKTLQKDLPADQLPQIVMISVDPERDTAAKMNSYVTTFNPNFVGLTGKAEDTKALEKQLNIVAVKVKSGKGKNNYYMDHSAEILLFNTNGELQAYMSYPHTPEQLVKDYKLMLPMLKA